MATGARGRLAARRAARRPKPIDLYFWPTPNGLKVSIMLEECGLPYNVIPVNIASGEQFKPAFLKISPNNRMPAIVDPDGPGGRPISVFESGAILQYLGRKTGRFYPENKRGRVAVDEWLFWQMANLGPKAGEANHFRRYAPRAMPYAIERFSNEMNRLYGVMNTRLKDRRFLAGHIRSPTWPASAGSGTPSGKASGKASTIRGVSASQALARRGARAAGGSARDAYPRRARRAASMSTIPTCVRCCSDSGRGECALRLVIGLPTTTVSAASPVLRNPVLTGLCGVNGALRSQVSVDAFTLDLSRLLNSHSNFLPMIPCNGPEKTAVGTA